jgi:predicted transcriptional regulator of viral defense system
MRSVASSAPKGRTQLTQVLQHAGNLVSVDDVTRALALGRSDAAKLLARWHEQGWMRRLRRGVYAPVPLSALGQAQVLEDPWVVVPELFGPAYIGGWSAAEHWGLTEQLFRSVCVITSRPIRSKEQTIQGIPFVVKHARRAAMFATRPVWRGSTRIDVSTPGKTVVDMLDDPVLGGGIRHVAECLDELLKKEMAPSKELIGLADRLGNGAVFKRMGFLLERRGGASELVEACHARLTTGNAKLDPALSCPRLVSRWRLWVPASWAREPR